MHPTSFQVPQGWTVTTAQSDLFAMYQCTPDTRDDDGDPAFYISGKIVGGSKLRFGIRTRYQGQSATQRGEQLFRLLVAYFQGVSVIILVLEANWSIGDLADNLRCFNNAIRQNISQNDAALKSTFTGKMAERVLQFTDVTFPPPGPVGQPGNFTNVVIEFST